jgi:membrane fusion protein, multidrug efflux system
MKNKRIVIAVVSAAVVAVLFFLFSRRATPEAEAEVKPAARVETAPLRSQPIAQTIEAFGVVESAPTSERTTPATYESVVVAILASPGSRVAAGEVIMEIAPSPDARLQLESARTAAALATQGLTALQERYDLKLATGQELLTARQAERDAREKLASYEARGMGGDGKLHAPVAGVISKLDLVAGSLVAVGAPLFAVAGGSNLEARLSVESGALALMARNQGVSLESTQQNATQQNDPDPIRTSVRVVGGALNPTSGSADVRVSVPPGGPLLLGERVRALIEVARKDAALVVPRRAVLPDEDGKQVLFTVKDGKAVRHEVEVGITTDSLVEVTASDLHAGDAVVTLGNYELSDGMEIQAAAEATEERAAKSKGDADKSPKGGKDEADADDSKDDAVKGEAKDSSKAPAKTVSKGDQS